MICSMNLSWSSNGLSQAGHFSFFFPSNPISQTHESNLDKHSYA
jgi:hypothetical protein